MSSTPEIYISWKGTDACIDFYCECGHEDHIDSTFVYFVKCAECNRVWAMPDFIPIEEVDPKVIVGQEVLVFETERSE